MSRISFAQIEAFYWVGELGSVQKAARRLGIAQPTVSLRLRLLEAEVGGSVIERFGRGIRMTAAGHALHIRAQLVLAAYRQMQSAASPHTLSGALRIGLAEGFATACLPHLVPALARAFPQLRPEWTVTTADGLERDLAENKLDLAVLVDAIGHRDVRLQPLGLQQNVLAVSPQFGLKSPIAPVDLSHLTMVTTPPPTSMYRKTFEWFAQSQESPGPLCLCSSLSVAAQLVAAGIGVGIFPLRMIEAYRGAGLIVLATDPPLSVGRVFVADHVTADQARTDLIMDVLADVTRSLGYFDKAPGCPPA